MTHIICVFFVWFGTLTCNSQHSITLNFQLNILRASERAKRLQYTAFNKNFSESFTQKTAQYYALRCYVVHHKHCNNDEPHHLPGLSAQIAYTHGTDPL